MAQSLVKRIGSSPVWRAGLASICILALAGFAAGVIPAACRNSFVICQEADPGELLLAALPAEAAPAELAGAAIEPAAVTAPQSAASSMVGQEPASLTSNDLIAQTFAALDVGLTPPSELTARKVRTVSISADGTPIAEGEAANEPVADASSEPERVEVAVVQPAPPPPVIADDEPSASAYAPVGKGSATIGRQGANIRTLPKTRGSEVLFALAAGEDVTVMETQNGWLKIVDDRGRSGWVWSDLVRR